MRDFLVTIVVLGGSGFALSRPFVGVLLWCWLGYMNPHRLTWSFAYDLPFAEVVAFATIVGLLLSREPKKLPLYPVTLIWLVFLAWMLLTTVFAIYPDAALIQCIKVMKIQFFIFVAMLIIHDQKRLDLLVWVIALSIAYYGVRGGIQTLLVGGSIRIWGPPGSFIEDNAAIGLALLMIVPLLRYLQLQASNKWVRWGMWPIMLLSMLAALGSQSRGAMLGFLAMVFVLWIKSRQKVRLALVFVVLLPAMYQFMPESWHQKMQTIETYEEDASSMARIYAWFVTINLANDRVLGGGFEPWVQPVFDRYGEKDFNLENTENPDKVVLAHAAHSIYFSILGEHGWIGLGLFLVVGVMAWRTGSWVLSRTRNMPELAPIRDLVAMLQVSLAAYATGGAFFSLSYWDLGWQLVSMLIICRVIVSQKLAELPVAGSPAGSVVRPLGVPLPAHASARTAYAPGRLPLSSGS